MPLLDPSERPDRLDLRTRHIAGNDIWNGDDAAVDAYLHPGYCLRTCRPVVPEHPYAWLTREADLRTRRAPNPYTGERIAQPYCKEQTA